MAKLTLSVDDGVVKRAKGYAARQGTSVSRLVERYLDMLSGEHTAGGARLSPRLARLRAEWRGASLAESDYRSHLERKYR